MSEPVVELSVATNWQRVWFETFEANETFGPRIYDPIIVTSAVQAESRILRAKGTSESAKPWWKKAYDLGILATGGIYDLEVRRVFVPLNEYTLIHVPDYATTFNLKVYVPWWLKDVTVDIDEYIGPIDDSTEILIRQRTEEIRADLSRIEGKVDEINQTINYP